MCVNHHRFFKLFLRFRNELNGVFLGFADSNSQKYPTLQPGLHLNLKFSDIIKRFLNFLASNMFPHLQHFLLYYNRIKTKNDSQELQQVFSKSSMSID